VWQGDFNRIPLSDLNPDGKYGFADWVSASNAQFAEWSVVQAGHFHITGLRQAKKSS